MLLENKRERLYEVIEHMPEIQVERLLLFAKFIEFENTNSAPTNTLLSEQSLSKEWLSKEEDLAWENL